MTRPSHVHSILPDLPEDRWLVQAQGYNECGSTAPANALTLLNHGITIFKKDQLLREAGLLFQARLGGSPSFVTGMLLRRHGAGTHFGNLSRTAGDSVLRDLIDRGVPVCIELGQNQIGPFKIYGQHSVVLVGYSEPYTDHSGARREEYYIVDAAHMVDGTFGLASNNVDRDGDGVPESYPGNRTYERADFWREYPTGIYFPVFPSQAAHDRWYDRYLRRAPRFPALGRVNEALFTGSYDLWVG